jgi:hypothetical protein
VPEIASARPAEAITRGLQLAVDEINEKGGCSMAA